MATFSVVATGTAPLSYQWRKNSTNISGATAASYTTPGTTTADNNAKFDVVVTNSVSSVTSAQATLTVNAAPVAPTITTQPANQTVAAGQTATFSVVATGTAPLSYQWRKNSTNISGATPASYTTPGTTTADNNATFDVVVANSVNSVTSSSATLTVNSVPVAPTITTRPPIKPSPLGKRPVSASSPRAPRLSPISGRKMDRTSRAQLRRATRLPSRPRRTAANSSASSSATRPET